jgi:hypothetical protein
VRLNEIAAEVSPEVDIVKLTNRWDAACGREERAEKSLAEIRLDKGRILVEAREAFPSRGPKAKGWGELLRQWRIEERTALRYMELAGYVEKVSDKVSEIPTYAEIGITKTKPPSATHFDVKEEPGAPFVALVETSTRAISETQTKSDDWGVRLVSLVEDMQRHVNAAFSRAQEIDALCAAQRASVGSPALITTRNMLLAVRATVADVLQKMEGSNGQ